MFKELLATCCMDKASHLTALCGWDSSPCSWWGLMCPEQWVTCINLSLPFYFPFYSWLGLFCWWRCGLLIVHALLSTPSNISHKGHVKFSAQADLSEGEKMQGSLILRSCVVDELQSAKEVYHCANNLEKWTTRREVGKGRAWGREEKRGKRERSLE